MRRWILAICVTAACLMAATPAEAFHHHWGRWGGGWGGYRGFGWGGYGYRGLGWGGYGYRGLGWGYPGYGYGGIGYSSYGYPGYGYGGIGYSGYGYPGYGYGGIGYSGYGYPGYSVGYYPSYYSSYSPNYGCYNYGGANIGTTVGLGYPGYGLYATAAPAANLIVTSRPVATTTAAPPPIVAPARPAPMVVAGGAAPNAVAIQKFLGLKDAPPLALASAPTAATPKPAAPVIKTFDDILSRFSNVESRRRGERMISEGDELFRAQNFHSALQKYKLAASTAPDLVEALWRQGHALVATHNYDLASAAFKRAIARTEDLGRGGFRLSDIYAGANMTKNQHLESLAQWASSRSNSSDPYFLLGLFLNYDGQQARAGKFFQKASELAGISGGHIAVFLAPAEEARPLPTERTVAPAAATPVVPISVGVEL